MSLPGSRSRFGRSKPLIFLSALAVSAASLADDGTAAPRFSGFATLAATHNDNATAGAIASSSQKHPAQKGWSATLDSAVGVQVDWQALADTSFVAQAVARAGNDLQPELRMAFVRQRLGNETAVRLGRIRSPLYFDSDVAEIGYAYMAVRPPLPLYGIVNSVNAMDGADVQWRHAIGDAAVMVQAYCGNYRYKHRFYNLNPVAAADADLRNIRGIAVSAALPRVTVRASRTWVDSYTMRSAQVDQLNAGLDQLSGGLGLMAMNPMLPAPMAAALTGEANAIAGFRNPFDNKPIYTSVGFDSNLSAWRVQGEWIQFDSRSGMVGKYRGYHLTAGYAAGDFTPYVSFARQDRKAPLLDTRALAATGMPGAAALDAAILQTKAGLDQAAHFADLSTRSVSIGVRWDFRENMALKAQFDRLNTPSATTPGYFAVSTLPLDNKTNLFTVALDVVF